MLLDAHDTWFCPTDVCLGPDGAIYVCDFYDARTAHPDPDADWDLDNGCVYKIEATDSELLEPFDLAKLSSNQLVDLLTHRNLWFRDRARVELAQRRDQSIVERLRGMAIQTNDAQLALQGLWAHYATV